MLLIPRSSDREAANQVPYVNLSLSRRPEPRPNPDPVPHDLPRRAQWPILKGRNILGSHAASRPGTVPRIKLSLDTPDVLWYDGAMFFA
jgi:hypothetical protein